MIDEVAIYARDIAGIGALFVDGVGFGASSSVVSWLWCRRIRGVCLIFLCKQMIYYTIVCPSGTGSRGFHL